MEFSLFVISKEEIDEATIMDFEREKVFIRPFMDENIEVEMTGHFYYEISNESSSSSNVNPYNRIEEVHDVLKTIYELGSFKLILLDEEKTFKTY